MRSVMRHGGGQRGSSRVATLVAVVAAALCAGGALPVAASQISPAPASASATASTPALSTSPTPLDPSSPSASPTPAGSPAPSATPEPTATASPSTASPSPVAPPTTMPRAQTPQAASGTLVLIRPISYQVIQRSPATGLADIHVTGKYYGQTSAVQARWRGGPWVTICAHPSGGRFDGWLRGQKAGQGTLAVRYADRPSITTSHGTVGIGDIFVIAGQSNASGRAPTMQHWSHPSLVATMFGNDLRWKRLADPVDSIVGQADTVSKEIQPVGGSVWPLLATHLLYGSDVPVAFVPAARGAVSMRGWLRRDSEPAAPGTLYGNMLRRVRAVGGHVRAILFWEGEADAGQQQTTEKDYQSMLKTFVVDVKHDMGARVIVSQVGDVPYANGTAGLNSVRAAQAAAASWTASSAVGPQLYDLGLDDEVHYTRLADLQKIADRWWVAIAGACYKKGDGRGPRLATAVYTASNRTITLTFKDAGPLSLPSGAAGAFSVHQSGGTVAVQSATRGGANVIRLKIASPASGSFTVSLGEGRSGALHPVPFADTHWREPAEWFIRRNVSRK